jgi:hypothetical protein
MSILPLLDTKFQSNIRKHFGNIGVFPPAQSTTGPERYYHCVTTPYSVSDRRPERDK